MSRARRATGVALILGALAGAAYLHHAATDFPAGEPLRVVDAALVERLRAEPGLHLPLARDHVLAVALELADDPLNRTVYGTVVDLREQRDERAIHIQVRADGRGAIHADGTNPKAGLGAWLIHATVDVPFLPLPLLLLAGLWLCLRRTASGTADTDPPRGASTPGG